MRTRGLLHSSTYRSAWWHITLPDNWCSHEDETCATFTRVPALGALQISAAKKEAGAITNDDLQRFASEQLHGSLVLRHADYGLFSGVVVDEVKKGRFWRHWWLASGQLMAYVTYNVELGNENVERADVELILSSLRPADSV